MKFSYIFAKQLFVGRKKLLLSYQSLCFHSIPRDWWQSKQKQNWNSDGFCAISLLRGSLLSEMCSFVPTAHFWHIYFIIKSTKTNPGICLAITFISIFTRVAQFNEIVDKKIQMCSPPEIFTRPTFTGYGADPSFFCIPICFEFQFWTIDRPTAFYITTDRGCTKTKMEYISLSENTSKSLEFETKSETNFLFWGN